MYIFNDLLEKNIFGLDWLNYYMQIDLLQM